MPLKILIVEDDPNCAKLWARLISKRADRATDIEIARTKAEALVQLHSDIPWDLVILDPGLPDNNSDNSEGLMEMIEAARPAPVKILTAGVDESKIATAIDLSAGITMKTDINAREDFLAQLFGDSVDELIQQMRETRRRVDKLASKIDDDSHPPGSSQ
jgi:DNA-binding NarL/FixJ family response regulator